MIDINDWVQLPGKAKRWKNVKTGEEISYRQARKREIPQKVGAYKRPEPKIPVRWATKIRKIPYKDRKKKALNQWQLAIKATIYYAFDDEEGEYTGFGHSKFHPKKDYPLMLDEAIDSLKSQLEGYPRILGYDLLGQWWIRW